jgi:hypothetical protein
VVEKDKAEKTLVVQVVQVALVVLVQGSQVLPLKVVMGVMVALRLVMHEVVAEVALVAMGKQPLVLLHQEMVLMEYHLQLQALLFLEQVVAEVAHNRQVVQQVVLLMAVVGVQSQVALELRELQTLVAVAAAVVVLQVTLAQVVQALLCFV